MRWSGFGLFKEENDRIFRPEETPIPRKVKRRQHFCKPHPYEPDRLTEQQQQAFKQIATKVDLQTVNFRCNVATLRMALQAPAKFRAALLIGKTFSIIMVSHASKNISNCKEDIVGALEPAPW